VSLTHASRQQVESFVGQFAVPWPCGYGASEYTPTLYVIGPDGHILWSDEEARPRHRQAGAALVQELEAELERNLAGGAISN
jgi:hypothetical protein